MIFNIFFSFFSDAKSASGKDKIKRRILTLLIDNYGGKSVNEINESKFAVVYESESWESVLFDVIKFSQSVGQLWVMTGNIDFELSLWSNHPKMVGLCSVGVDVDNVIVD